VLITTDKVYQNKEVDCFYQESDILGGYDPYSASKACCELIIDSYRNSFFNTKDLAKHKKAVGVARAGNVIGGGDWAVDRLVPELVKANQSNQLPTLRYPDSIRPWQHVLDCLRGYLKLVDKMIAEGIGGEWNFGPDHLVQKSVSQLVNAFAISWGNSNADKYWELEVEPQPHESGYLLLDSSKSQRELAWIEKLNFEDSIDWTVEWFKDSINFGAREITIKQIKNYLST
jgi:CDP-glucose 4,6-dehydratase